MPVSPVSGGATGELIQNRRTDNPLDGSVDRDRARRQSDDLRVGHAWRGLRGRHGIVGRHKCDRWSAQRHRFLEVLALTEI